MNDFSRLQAESRGGGSAYHVTGGAVPHPFQGGEALLPVCLRGPGSPQVLLEGERLVVGHVQPIVGCDFPHPAASQGRQSPRV